MEPAKFSFKGFRIVDAELHFDKVVGNYPYYRKWISINR